MVMPSEPITLPSTSNTTRAKPIASGKISPSAEAKAAVADFLQTRFHVFQVRRRGFPRERYPPPPPPSRPPLPEDRQAYNVRRRPRRPSAPSAARNDSRADAASAQPPCQRTGARPAGTVRNSKSRDRHRAWRRGSGVSDLLDVDLARDQSGDAEQFTARTITLGGSTLLDEPLRHQELEQPMHGARRQRQPSGEFLDRNFAAHFRNALKHADDADHRARWFFRHLLPLVRWAVSKARLQLVRLADALYPTEWKSIPLEGMTPDGRE